MAKVYLYQRKWDECLNACDEVIKSGKYSLLPDFRNLFLPENDNSSSSNKLSFLDKFKFLHLGAVTIVAISIVIGEFGDKTFLASLGLGLEYPDYKFSLICGSIFGMVLSNLLAIFCGKFLSHYLKPSMISFLSNVIFLAFGILGLAGLFIDLISIAFF